MNTNHCLDETTATQLVLGTLQAEKATESEEHLLECQSCLQLVESTMAQDGLVTALQTSEPQGDSLDAEVDAVVEDLDLLARPAQTAASAFAEIEPLLCDTDIKGQLGRFANFRILEVLGAGGMGIVLKAEDELLGRMVALKFMRPSLAVNEQSKQRFRREAKAIAAFEHNHIVTVYDVEEHDGTPYFIMEWLEGESLRDRLQRAVSIPTNEALRITRELAQGLAAAHARGLLHRDIKPDNIWLQNALGEVKILDFGLVQSIESNASLTHSGAIVGTPEYMAPEQACGESIDQRCDLFSVGCVLYHMLTGRPPFRGKNVVATLVAISNAKLEPPHEVEPTVPREISDLTVKLLQRDPEQRFASAEELTEAVEELETQFANPRRLSNNGGGWFWPVLCALGAAAVLAGVLAIKTNHGTLYIDTNSNDDVTALVDGETVELKDKATGKKYKLTVGASKLKPGEYEIVATEDGSDLQFSAREFQLHRGEHQIVRAWLDGSQTQIDDYRAKVSDTAIMLQKDRTQRMLKALAESKKTQAATVARLQRLIKTLAKELDMPVDGFGRRLGANTELQQLADRIALNEFEIDELEAAIDAQQVQLEEGVVHVELLSESSIPAITDLRYELKMQEEMLKKIEATTRNGKESTVYVNTMNKLEALRESTPAKIEELKLKAARAHAERQLFDKKVQLEQKQSLMHRLEDRYKELRDKASDESKMLLEFELYSQELQRALGLFAKISERESELSATVGLPKELADELWGDKPMRASGPKGKFVPPQPAN